MPFSPLTRTPLFSVEDYAAFTSRLSRDQMRALPFSVRRKLKALLVTGTASEADAAAVSEHLDPLLYVSGVQPLRSLLPEEAEQLTNQATEATALLMKIMEVLFLQHSLIVRCLRFQVPHHFTF